MSKPSLWVVSVGDRTNDRPIAHPSDHRPFCVPSHPSRMVQTSFSSPAWSERFLCYYINTSGQIQLARIVNIPGWMFERLVFPGQRLLFEAVPDALLEVHAPATTETLIERIPCFQLRVNEHAHLPEDSSDSSVDFAEYADPV